MFGKNLVLSNTNYPLVWFYQFWHVLSHNIRGINSSAKWNSIGSAIGASVCDVICLQEIKRKWFDESYSKNFSSSCFDNFAYIPSIGNSGGSIIIWKSSKLDGNVTFRMNTSSQLNSSQNLLVLPKF
jgi:exonuclease III